MRPELEPVTDAMLEILDQEAERNKETVDRLRRTTGQRTGGRMRRVS